MLLARVVGNVWATRRLPEIPNGAFLEVEVEGGGRLVAFDVLGTGAGERVLVATGSVAAGWFGGTLPPLDALIIGSVDAAEEPPAPPDRSDLPTGRSSKSGPSGPSGPSGQSDVQQSPTTKE